MRGASLFGSRIETAFGIALLALALLLIRFFRLSRWRWTLGSLLATPLASEASGERMPPGKARDLALSLARADWRLPWPTKCLARAVALQWRLRLTGIPSLLVIAVHRTDRSGEHAFHAWTESAGGFLTGHCDRACYRPIMVFTQGVSDTGISVPRTR